MTFQGSQDKMQPTVNFSSLSTVDRSISQYITYIYHSVRQQKLAYETSPVIFGCLKLMILLKLSRADLQTMSIVAVSSVIRTRNRISLRSLHEYRGK